MDALWMDAWVDGWIVDSLWMDDGWVDECMYVWMDRWRMDG